MPTLHLLRVFCSDDGSGGNPLGVFLDGASIPEASRQAVALELGLSETVFVDDAAAGRVRIFTPAVELAFAGHPSVGTAWLLAEQGIPVTALNPPAGEVAVRHERGLTFCSARSEWSPPFEWIELGSPDEVDALDGAQPGHDLTGYWAWIDEGSGTIRARVFPVRIGIDEDEATGSAVVLLAQQLERAIDVRQGRGSRLRARPHAAGRVEFGGRSVLDEVREYAVPGR
jgi:predicted PhzF superfamily epimerase YddE/YHI9